MQIRKTVRKVLQVSMEERLRMIPIRAGLFVKAQSNRKSQAKSGNTDKRTQASLKASTW
jgi:hypothetical protein